MVLDNPGERVIWSSQGVETQKDENNCFKWGFIYKTAVGLKMKVIKVRFTTIDILALLWASNVFSRTNNQKTILRDSQPTMVMTYKEGSAVSVQWNQKDF